MTFFLNAAKWAADNPSYGLAVLVGSALGVFYGFDGWRGSTEDLEFKDSPRTKNLVWVLTVALATIIGDVRAVDESAKKPFLLLVYCEAVLVGASIVVLVGGLLVLIDNLSQGRRLGYAYGSMDALGDYFYFGYRKYRERKENIASRKRRNFHQDYVKQLAYSITAAGSVTEGQRLLVARNILRHMTAVVRKYRGESATAQIRANLMIKRSWTPEMSKRIRFKAEGVVVESCLELFTYDSEDGDLELVLPLPAATEAATVLPGAPAALIGEAPIIVDDTINIPFASGVSNEIKKAMEDYFASKQKSFRSFASLPVFVGGRAIIVVNIDSSEVNVLGNDEADKKEIVDYLAPFCAALGILVKGMSGGSNGFID